VKPILFVSALLAPVWSSSMPPRRWLPVCLRFGSFGGGPFDVINWAPQPAFHVPIRSQADEECHFFGTT